MTAVGDVIVDLSVPLGPGPSELLPCEVETVTHREGGVHLAEMLGVEVDELPGGLGWASERLATYTHTGTHMDAPFHCVPTSGGHTSRTIDAVPLEWCWNDGVCVHLAERPGEARAELDELLAFESRWGEIREGTIVLFRTGAEVWHGTPRYVEAGRPLAPDIVHALVGRGVRIIGTDAWSIDPSLPAMREVVGARGPEAAWEAHKAVEDGELCIIERLCNLEKLPPRGFRVACFPIKLRGGSAGWVRPVAFLPQGGVDAA